MSVRLRNNVTVSGSGPTTIVFAHGFGCDQVVWRFMAPAFEARYRVVVFDLVGSGNSDLTAYDRERYASLHAYADDLLEIIDDLGGGPVVYVGHSVSTMIGLLAGIKAPARFLAQVMIAPSPCFVDDAGYHGGFSRGDIEELLETMDANYLGWSSSMGPVIMGAPNRPQLGVELTNNFCRNDPDIAKHFGRVTFLADHRADLEHATVPTLILQCSDDLIAPAEVGDYLHRRLAGSVLRRVRNVGHCPHMSAPEECVHFTKEFLASLGQPA
ncbi:alpha/beta fold hydrolase [Massilia sp. Leaf139]|uniref:alpha/beta fold hydrolase n=1 Tax=Massilia sp. Leaf139 TaxID=1736272 RepID=UPI0006FC7367|nr:alpha/beta hydrolase [Massilia sp. Leaf139]KQQ91839.1 sigma factor sigB regulation protein rsbQ [Massilia sp. Leaf139]